MQERKRAVIYTRVSSKEQVEKGYSLDAQEKILRECIEREKNPPQEFIDIYSDKGISGKNTEDRAEVKRLLADAAERRFDYLWVIDQDRLSRGDLAALNTIKVLLKSNGVVLCTPSQKLDFADVDADFMSDIFGAVAKSERLKFIQRANRGRREKATRGEWHGATAPFGYSFDMQKDKHLLVNEEEKRIYRKIVSLCLEFGYGIRKTADYLNKNNLKARKIKMNPTGLWRMQNIHYILTNPTYLGQLVDQRYKYLKEEDSEKFFWRKTSNHRVFKKAHKALCTEEEFDAIQAQLAKHRSKNRTLYSVQLLTGILKCSLCGNSFKVGGTGGPANRQWVYRCKTTHAHWYDKTKPDCKIRTFNVAEYNDKVWAAFQAAAKNPELIMKKIRESQEPLIKNLKSYEQECDEREAELRKFDRYKENARREFIKEKTTEAEYYQDLNNLEDEEKTLTKELRELKAKISYLKRTINTGVDKEAVLQYLSFIYQSDKELDIAQKRKLLGAFVNDITIYGNGEFEFNFKFSLPQEAQQDTMCVVNGATTR